MRSHLGHRFVAFCAAVACGLTWCAAPSGANTSNAGWPTIDGMRLMNQWDQSRPLDGRAGGDPFDGTDETYGCNHSNAPTTCIPHDPRGFVPGIGLCTDEASGRPLSELVPPPVLNDAGRAWCPAWAAWPRPSPVPPAFTANRVPSDIGHNELLGGHGNDRITAGPRGDVIWGDYKPSGQPTTQTDVIRGGPGNDVIYTSHGRSDVTTGGGRDVVHAHFGRGVIRCQSAATVVFVSRRGQPGWRLIGCRHVSHFSLGY